MKIKKSIEDYEDGDEALEKLSAPADWNGPVENRRCTDLFFLFLIILSWAAMTWIGIYATHNGDYRLVLYPLDYDGNVCGTDYNGRDMMA
jgi:choline transporter-like protein 2/4/5